MPKSGTKLSVQHSLQMALDYVDDAMFEAGELEMFEVEDIAGRVYNAIEEALDFIETYHNN